MKQEITYEDYNKVDIKVGTVIKVSRNEKARKPSLVVEVDFGDKIGVKKSSAQITHYYNEENLVGKQVIGVCNFPKKKYSRSSFRGSYFRSNRKRRKSGISPSVSKS